MPEFPDSNPYTVEFLEQDLERAYPISNQSDHFICDWCATGVSYSGSEDVGIYFADGIINTRQLHGKADKELVPLARYCEDCTNRLLLLPAQDFTEVRAFVTFESEALITDATVKDISPADDGIPWSPREAIEQVTGSPFDVYDQALEEEDMLMGPENVVTAFESLSDDTDIREMIRPDGTFDQDMLETTRDAAADGIGSNPYEKPGRKEFRDHVRGE